MKVRTWIFRILAILVLVGIAACMMVIGRGHTVYFDNKTYESEDGSVVCKAAESVVLRVKGQEEMTLEKRERKGISVMGQSLSFTVEVTQKFGEDALVRTCEMQIPYSWDGMVINLPALVAELGEEIYLTEFTSVAITGEAAETEEPAVTDEFGISDFEG